MSGGGGRQAWYKVLYIYIQVLVAIVIGVLIGHFAPQTGVALKPLGDAFIALIRMMIAPVIFCTLVHGIASMSDLGKVGRVGVKALVYFGGVSTLALAIGLIVGRTVQPGAGFDIDPGSLDGKAVATYVTRAHGEGIVSHLMAIIPDTFVGAFARGDLLQILLVSILVGIAAARIPMVGPKVVEAVDVAGKVFFRIIGIIVKAAPIGAFGAMAYTVGAYGLGSLLNLLALIATFYLTSLLFVLVVLGAIARLCGFSILRFIAYIKDELLIVLGTSSSETVLPHMIAKMERLGASRSVVGLVIPTGYSFNLDGTNIYMTLATLFLAQATNTPLTLGQELAIIGIAMLNLEGRVRRHRRGLRHPGGDALDHPRHPDRLPRHSGRHRQVHERVPRADQPRRQRCRDHRGKPLGRRAGHGAAARSDGAPDRARRGNGGAILIRRAVLAAILLLVGASGGRAQERVVNVYNWTDYIDPAVLDRFTTETGIKVRYDVYDSLETLEGKLLVGHSGYDVVVPTSEPTFSRLIRAGALQPLDKANLPHFAGLDPVLMREVATSDPGNRYGAIYLWGTTGLGMIESKVTALAPGAPLDSWDLLFKPENAKRLAPCGVTIMDSGTDVIPSVLLYAGRDPNSTDPADLAAAETVLLGIRPYVRNFQSGGAIEALASGQTCLVLSYSGDMIQAAARAQEAGQGVAVRYVAPREGAQVAFDMLAVPSDAPHPEAAAALIDFLLRPDVMAAITNKVRYANAVPASRPMIAPAIANDPAIFPSPEQVARFFTVRALPIAAERARSRMWARFKAGN